MKNNIAENISNLLDLIESATEINKSDSPDEQPTPPSNNLDLELEKNDFNQIKKQSGLGKIIDLPSLDF